MTSFGGKSVENAESSAVAEKLAASLQREIGNREAVFFFIGCDSVISDSVAPLCGTLLENEAMDGLFFYGSLKYPVTALNVERIYRYIREFHRGAVIVAVDSAVGAEDEIGVIKLVRGGLKPALALKKNLERVGDLSLLVIIAKRTEYNVEELRQARLGRAFDLSSVIAEGIRIFSRMRKNERI